MQVDFLKNSKQTFEKLARDVFFALRVSFAQIHYAFAEKPDFLGITTEHDYWQNNWNSGIADSFCLFIVH